MKRSTRWWCVHLYCSEMAVREVPDYQRTSVKVGTGHPQLTGIRRVGVAFLQRGGTLLGEVVQKGGEAVKQSVRHSW